VNRRDLLLLFLIGLIVALAISRFQSLPGYMDADYYFGGGIQLAMGYGFTEPYLWNYLADPPALPAPSHLYWMPLASIVAAAGMALAGETTFAAARLGFLLLAASVPALTGILAFRLTQRRGPALVAGLLAAFSGYYAPFLSVTDNYGIYMLLGTAFLLALPASGEAPERPIPFFDRPGLRFWLLGILAGLMTLARSDGLLWLGLAWLAALGRARRAAQAEPGEPRPAPWAGWKRLATWLALTLLGFLLPMGPWYLRNWMVVGALTAPGTARLLWLTDYNDTFLYPASQLTVERWLASGWEAILLARLNALRWNLLNAFAAQGSIFLFPFILIGIWQLRRDRRVRLAGVGWLLLLLVMTVVFPFAGSRGAFFHAGAAFQPLWWSLAPLGLDETVHFVRRRGWFDDHAYTIFRAALVGIALLMTFMVVILRVLPGWEREDGHYRDIETFLRRQTGAPLDQVIMVRNPPGYYVATGRLAIVTPTGERSSVLAAAERYRARYLLLESQGALPALKELYKDPSSHPRFRFLGEIDGHRLYEILP